MQREDYFSEYFSVWNYLSAFALWSHGSWNAALLPFRSGQMCLLEKKLSLLLKLLQRTELFFCVFFVFFVVYFVFRFLPLRLTQNHPDAKKFFSFSSHYLTNICWSHHQWLHIKWVKITNIKMGSPSKISPFKMYCSWWVQSISQVVTLTCAKNTIE